VDEPCPFPPSEMVVYRIDPADKRGAMISVALLDDTMQWKPPDLEWFGKDTFGEEVFNEDPELQEG
jgi:hypothetical protein